jgi:hypothetical protein
MYGAEKAKTIVAKLELIGKLFDHYKSLHPGGLICG